MLLRILGMAAIDGALAFDIAAFFAKLLVGFPTKKRVTLFSLLIIQDFLIKAAITWSASWLASITVLKILGGIYLIFSVVRSKKGHSSTRESLKDRLLQGMTASFFLNIDAAVSNGTLAQGHVWLLFIALGMSAVVICVVMAGFSWLAGRVAWMKQVENLILSGTAGYLIAASARVEAPALMVGIIVLVVVPCLNSNRIISLLKRGWRFLMKRR
ncbi:hypothetical protein KSF_036750 [Reticulibacter mediterranei]|uniref:Uncharacterized protein n=1 Tax=Reticulibacter mediterranei TaxID=2778369 RepID=A0A8J3ILV0_9CHLR|nr:hypothetical protein [Reticulibacter mediterranei]GHO93627.1 hypothetical protein KSF_036750 [Reticulibacter mediterranei]